MRALLLPVKDLRNAKQRLAGVLTPEERFGLGQAMLADTIRAIEGVRQADKIFVITNYQPVMDIAEENAWVILREDRQISESHAVDFASRVCEERGVTGLLRVPLDVPLVQPSDIDELLTIECGKPGLVIVPSRDGTGTNAIFRTPPALFPSHFGEGSFAKHLAEAKRAAAQVFIRSNSRLELDVDDEADLGALLEHNLTGTETGRWLRETGSEARFRRDGKKASAAAGNHL
ncbi:MAG TPA: 2-phospho-L-lactate guanylyltransferase [Candidatus Dormibacteraeota bacterium]|nr:2-phospho-L-lactate guanylyltransferase [Candidatus Dormibacteraeota bacterium]